MFLATCAAFLALPVEICLITAYSSVVESFLGRPAGWLSLSGSASFAREAIFDLDTPV